MFDWIKSISSAIAVAALAFVAFMAARKATGADKQARRWQERADLEVQAQTEQAVDNAKAAIAEADKHKAKAEQAKKKAEERINAIARRDDSMADIVDRWRVLDDDA